MGHFLFNYIHCFRKVLYITLLFEKVAQGTDVEPLEPNFHPDDGGQPCEPLLPSYPQLYTPKSSIKYKSPSSSVRLRDSASISVNKEASLYSMLLNDGTTVNCLLKDNEIATNDTRTSVEPSKAPQLVKQSESGLFSSLIFPGGTNISQKSSSTSIKINQDSSPGSSQAVSSPDKSLRNDQISPSDQVINSCNFPTLSAMMMNSKMSANPFMQAINITTSIPEIVAYDPENPVEIVNSVQSKVNTSESEKSQETTDESVLVREIPINDAETANSALRLIEEPNVKSRTNNLYPHLSIDSPSDAPCDQTYTPMVTNVNSEHSNITADKYYSPLQEIENKHRETSTEKRKDSEIIFKKMGSSFESSTRRNLSRNQTIHSNFIPAPPQRRKRNSPPKPPLRTSLSTEKQTSKDVPLRNMKRNYSIDDADRPDRSSFHQMQILPQPLPSEYLKYSLPVSSNSVSTQSNGKKLLKNNFSSSTDSQPRLLGYSISGNLSSSDSQPTNITCLTEHGTSTSSVSSERVNLPIIPDRQCNAISVPQRQYEPSSRENNCSNVLEYKHAPPPNISHSPPNRILLDSEIDTSIPNFNNNQSNDRENSCVSATATSQVELRRVLPVVLPITEHQSSGREATIPPRGQSSTPLPGTKSAVPKRTRRPLRRGSAVVPPPPPPRLSKTVSDT